MKVKLLVAAVAASLALAACHHHAKAIGGLGGPFTLVDAKTGATVTEQFLHGKPTLLFFGYTSCPDVCPTALVTAGRWLKTLGSDADKIRFVFVSVDPARDTPEKLKQYLGAFDSRIVGLTGSQKQVDQIIADYHVVAEKVPMKDGNYSMNHTALIHLINEQGEFVGTVDFEDKDDVALAKIRGLI